MSTVARTKICVVLVDLPHREYERETRKAENKNLFTSRREFCEIKFASSVHTHSLDSLTTKILAFSSLFWKQKNFLS